MARVDLPQSKLRARRRRQKLFTTLKIAAIVAVVVGFILGISWLPHLRIVNVVVKGAEGSAARAIEDTTLNYIAGTYTLLFPKNNILMYPKSALTKELHEKFPRLADVQVYAEDFRTLGVEVRERTPGSLWCGESLAAQGPCLLMDESGTAYEVAAEFSGVVYTEYFGAATAGMPRQYLEPEQFNSLSALVQAFKDKEGESIARVVVDEHNDVRATFTNGFTLMFTLNADSGDVYERFLLAKTAEPFTTHTLTDFDYLDLRFGDRLYYKLK